MKISVSILNAKDKKETIKILNNTDISYFHIDVMDGNFVKQISIPVEETLEISRKLGSQFMGNLFRLMRLIDESGHHEIVDKFQAELCDEINKSLEKD